MSARMLAGCLLIAGLASGGAAADSGFAFRGGDRVVFLGDSITEQKLYRADIEVSKRSSPTSRRKSPLPARPSRTISS